MKEASILIVDDEIEICRLMRDMLEMYSECQNVRTANSGFEALEILMNVAVDVMITDIRMPDMDGIELTKKASAVQEDIQVIVATAYADLENAVDALRAGAINFLTKPVSGEIVHFAVLNAWKKKHAIDERKKFSNWLEESMRFSQRIAETSPDIIYIRDIAQGKNIYENRNVVKLLGYSMEERKTVTDWMSELVHPDDIAVRKWEEAGNNDILSREYRVRAGNGEWRWFQAREAVFQNTPDGKVSQIAGSVRDVTDQKRLESELRRAKDAADAANRAKSSFLANMSHELRTPLNAVMGFAQILERDPDSKEKQRELANSIHRSGLHLLTLVNDLLDIARIEAGIIKIRNAEFDLQGFLTTIMGIIDTAARKKNINLVCEPGPGLPMTVNGDETRLRQVLINLLGNAVKFTEKGKVVLRVDCPDAEIQYGDSDLVKIRFQVEDTGAGIPEDRIGEIFMPFRQVDGNDISTEGTGLGLAITRHLVRLMGGDILVESALGKGSLFQFELEFTGTSEAEIIFPKAERPVPAKDFIPPPFEELEVLRKMAKAGKIRDIREKAEYLLRQYPEYKMFCERLSELSKRFEIDKIIRLINGGSVREQK